MMAWRLVAVVAMVSAWASGITALIVVVSLLSTLVFLALAAGYGEKRGDR